jgi:transporter family protein
LTRRQKTCELQNQSHIFRGANLTPPKRRKDRIVLTVNDGSLIGAILSPAVGSPYSGQRETILILQTLRAMRPSTFYLLCLCWLTVVAQSFGPRPLLLTPSSSTKGEVQAVKGRHGRQHHVMQLHAWKNDSQSSYPLWKTLRGGSVLLASATQKAPAATWMGPALLCALSYALYNLFIKKASSQIDPILGGVLLQFVAATAGSMLWLLQPKGKAVPTRAAGLAWAAAAGLAVGAAEMLSFWISSMGVPAMQSIPIVVGGSVLLGTLLGSLWLREVLSWRGWCGVALISAGIALVGMDPSSVSAH